MRSLVDSPLSDVPPPQDGPKRSLTTRWAEDAAASAVGPQGDGPRLLVIAFGFRPDVGSEEEAGWAFARIAAGIGETWVLYRPRAGDDSAEVRAPAIPEASRLHLVPVRQRFIGGRPPTTADWAWERVEYLLWQLRALRVARRIARRERIDLVWHVSWSAWWLGTVGGLVGPPFIWGPILGGVGPPWPVLTSLGARGIAVELARWVTQRLAGLINPLVWVGFARAALILVGNSDVTGRIPRFARPRVEVFHRVTLDESTLRPRPEQPAGRPPTAIYSGRLLPWKGCWLAIEAIALLDGWRLLVCGAGSDESRLRGRAKALGAEDRVSFRGQVARTEVLRMMREEADVFVFPSLHEEGGWAVGDAIASHLPVICVDRGGPPTIVGWGVPLGPKDVTVRRIANAMEDAIAHPRPSPPIPTLEPRRAALVEVLRARGLIAPEPVPPTRCAEPVTPPCGLPR